ncbi:MAG: hypothetical protein AAFV07_04635 [Bacteroidota bacterium]
MTETKLIKLLRIVEADELHWLGKWVRSPYYNRNSAVIGLFDLLRTFAPDFKSNRLKREWVFQRLFPDMAYQDGKLRLIMHRLTEQVEGFLVSQRLKQQPLVARKLLFDELGERNQYDLFLKQYKSLTKEIEGSTFRDEVYHQDLWQLQYQHFFHPRTTRIAMSGDALSATMQHLDAAYMLTKMRYSAELLSRQHILKEVHEIELLEPVREIARTHTPFKDDKAFQMYEDLLALMDAPENETIFLRLDQNVRQYLELLRPDFQASLIRYLINNCIRQYNAGKIEFLERQFDLYKIALEKGLLLNDGLLPDATFLNIVVTATTLGEAEWATQFVQDYLPVLPADRQEDASRLGSAFIDFSLQKYQEVNRHLRLIQSNAIFYLLRVKSLSLRNHFLQFLEDPGYYELVIHGSRSFDKFLQRNPAISERRIQAYLHLTAFIRSLARLISHQEKSPERIKQLRKELDKTETIIARQWLEKVLDNL